jgi:histidyl-tRNA synthetase
LNIKLNIELDLTLARGLNYYTGAIFEVKANDVEIGSICGGGRYDNLTGIFGLDNVSGVGISFGADRIYDVLNQLNKYPVEVSAATKVLITNFGEKEQLVGLKILQKLRSNFISSELYPDNSKIKKQMSYADSRNIPFVILIGEEEIKSGKFLLKDMKSGEQSLLDENELLIKLQ